MSKATQTAIGLGLASAIIGTWLLIQIYAVFFFRIRLDSAWAVVALMMLETWLGAGMFIVAHDAMHGSLSPQFPSLNRWVGRFALGLYAFFPYDKVMVKHYAHHRLPGQDGDPDFHADRPRAFWAWYWRFFTQYFSLLQVGAISAVVLVYLFVLHAEILNILLLWAAPSILSSIQLFTFGTWLPHRHDDAGFSDRHNARTLEYDWIASLAACYHFGYHIEHHRSPNAPWWSLPKVRSRRRAQEALA